MSDFNASGGILSGFAAFPLLICQMASHPDFFDRSWSDIGRKVYVSGGLNAAGIFESSPKYPIHLFFFSSISVIGLPSLYLNDHSGLHNISILVSSLHPIIVS